MNYRKFGNTDLVISEIGFGAWAIGGPALAGNIPIGWGNTDDETSRKAITMALDQGINFFDTADFYGLGHSEELLGKVIGKDREAVIATKAGHRLRNDGSIFVDYSASWIKGACEDSLKRLKRTHIDYYQLHTAKIDHLMEGDCLEALEELKTEGKIRYWGVSLNTFKPEPEANYLIDRRLGHGFQLVFNIINQRAAGIIRKAAQNGYGIIARMPLQFGLLTGKFNVQTKFDKDDHRSFRLPPALLSHSLDQLKKLWPVASGLNISPANLSLRFLLSYPEITTVIAGMRTPEQVLENTSESGSLDPDVKEQLQNLYQDHFHRLVDEMEKTG